MLIAEFETSQFAEFAKRDDELGWFSVLDFEREYILEPTTFNKKYPLVKDHNPDWFIEPGFHDPMINAQFPAQLTHEEIDEATLKEAVGKAALHLAKSFAKNGKGGFVPTPVGDATSQRGFAIHTGIKIYLQQQKRATCIFSCFASAL